MIEPRDEKTRKFLQRLRKQDRKLRDVRRRAKKDRFEMRLARVVFGCDGSKTEYWVNN